MIRLPKVTIVIAANRRDAHLQETIRHCLKLDYPNFDIIVIPTTKFKFNHKRVKVIPVGNKPPAYKRGIGVKNSKGDIIAFIDDDAYPRRDWLKKAVKYLSDDLIVGVGGPAVTPSNDSLMQKAGGCVLESRLGSGSLTFRYAPKPNRFVDDYQSCNLILRKKVLKLKWFECKVWPGEDTELVLNIVKFTGKKVLYANDVVVYHHRRALFKPHLKQIYGYGSHRGYFARVLPTTSRKITYFFPSLLFGFFALGLSTFLWNTFLFNLFILLSPIYFLVILLSSIRRSKYLFPLVFLGIFLTHIVYGFAFIKGFLFGVKKR